MENLCQIPQNTCWDSVFSHLSSAVPPVPVSIGSVWFTGDTPELSWDVSMIKLRAPGMWRSGARGESLFFERAVDHRCKAKEHPAIELYIDCCYLFQLCSWQPQILSHRDTVDCPAMLRFVFHLACFSRISSAQVKISMWSLISVQRGSAIPWSSNHLSITPSILENRSLSSNLNL